MSIRYLQGEQLARALAVRDLTDPQQGPHAMQKLLALLHESLAARWGCRRLLHRPPALVTSADSADLLGQPAAGNGAAQPHYVTPGYQLRSRTSAAIPALLRGLSIDPPDDLLLICPGLAYRYDGSDQGHFSAPHQLELWRIHNGQLGGIELAEMVRCVVQAALPGRDYRLLPTAEPYVRQCLQIEVSHEGVWMEIGRCGLADHELLRRCGLDPQTHSGLAMELELDHMLVLHKGIPDISLLRSQDPRIAAQMLDLEPYRPIASAPARQRELS